MGIHTVRGSTEALLCAPEDTACIARAGCGRIAYGAPSEACEAGKAAPGNFGTLKECRGPVLGFVGAIVVYTRMGVFACVFQRPLKRSIF